MGISKTLWEILDHQRRQPALVDTRDPGTLPLRSDLEGIVTVSADAEGQLVVWSER